MTTREAHHPQEVSLLPSQVGRRPCNEESSMGQYRTSLADYSVLVEERETERRRSLGRTSRYAGSRPRCAPPGTSPS